MKGEARSLLAYLDAPVLVGDPEGHAVYVNPAFERRFAGARGEALGRPVAELFEGGARESVLRAVAQVCEYGESVRFRVREQRVGFSAVASPIVAEAARVGVVILLKEEVEGAERLLGLYREIRDPLDELGRCLDALLEQTGGRRDQRHRIHVEDGLRALARLRKWSDEVAALVGGHSSSDPADARFEPAAVVHAVGARIRREIGEGPPEVRTLAPSSLPAVKGDGARLESVLLRMLRARLEGGERSVLLTLGARPAGAESVLVSLTEDSAQGGYAATASESPVVQEQVAALGGELHATADPRLGRTVVLRLPVAAHPPPREG